MPADPPARIVALADERAAARSRRDWPEADRLKAQIEAAGWKVVDAGLRFALAPAHAPDVVVRGRTRFGHASSVPSRFAEPPVGVATVVFVADDDAAATRATFASLLRHAPAGTQIVAVADAPAEDVETALEAPSAAEDMSPRTAEPVELVLTAEPLGLAATIDAGVRRAAAPVVMLLGSGVDVRGDVVTPLRGALDDPTVGVAGPWGLLADDLRHLREAPAGVVDAIEIACVAFRRADYAESGPIDERLRTDPYVGLWLSLALREMGEGPPRRAVALDGLPVARRATDRGEGGPPADLERLGRRDHYRVLDRFGRRQRELLGAAAAAGDARGASPGS